MTFRDKMQGSWDQGKFVCVGLDSELGKIPEAITRREKGTANHILGFNAEIMDATLDFAGFYKPNIAFYAACGVDGLAALRDTISRIHAKSGVPVILDVKRADIGNTNAGYIQEAFEYFGADAVTVHPYLGAEALQPFLDREDKGLFVLCRTSNPGSAEFQSMDVCGDSVPGDYMPLSHYVAHRVATAWNKNWNCGLVVGAPFVDDLQEIRQRALDLPFLIPGVGFQTAGKEPMEVTVRNVVTAGKDSRGQGMIINSSRGIIFASSGDDFAEAARRETVKLHELIQNALQSAA